MNRKLIIWFGLLGLTVACHKAAEKSVAPAEKKETPRVQHGTNGETVLNLDKETQKRMELGTQSLENADLPPELKAFGRVLDPSQLVTQVADLRAAQITSDASAAELNRLKSLAASDNASAKSVQTAEASAAKDHAQYEAARLKLLASWGPLATRQDLASLVESFGKLENVLVQVNLPADESLSKPPQTARITTLNGKDPIQAEFMGPAAASDPQTQGRGYLFVIKKNQENFSPGMAVNAFLGTGEKPLAGAKIPASAVVQKNGAPWIYLKTGDETFARVKISTDRPITGGWFVTDPKAGETIVISGAQELLSEEVNAPE
jgi:hypothetical protein